MGSKIISERYSDYIDSLGAQLPAELETLYRYAQDNQVPVIRRQTCDLLMFLLTEKRPLSILEVGSAIGFSALFMAAYMPSGAHITTIEKDEKRAQQAKENFSAFQKDEEITLLMGDAADILETLPENGYDMIFMDAAKGQYIRFLPRVKMLLKNGGLLVSDNVLSDGQIIESRFAVTRRNRTIHQRMRDYLFALTHDDELVTTVLTVADGMALSVKRDNIEEKK
ncbi:MAG: O-methyltransferase [Lachnospiraceae bacterium]|nr:O-methyltransferase [Lachnospiraceae bacterium]